MARRRRAAASVLLSGFLAALLSQSALAAPTAAAASAAGVAAAALAAAPGAQLTVSGLQMEGESVPSSLQLQRRDVWSSGSQVVVHGAAGESRQAPPQTRWFIGNLAGAPTSSVMLAVHPDGRMTGTAARAGTSWSLTGAPAGPTAAAAGSGRLVARKAAASRAPTAAAAVAQQAGRRCGNKGRMVPPGRTSKVSVSPVAAAATIVKPATSGPLMATVAVDTDAEFYNLFGNAQDAANYVALLVAYLDVVYSREIGVSIKLGQLELRPNRTAADYPEAYKPVNLLRAAQGLKAVMNWWNANRQDVPRTVTMYLSGQRRVKDVGMAWDEVLCDWYQATEDKVPSNNWAYGFLSNMEGDFSWNGINNPTAVTWDVYNMAHELGHCFGSPHTHEFCNILGNPNTIDNCVQSDGYYFQGQDKPVCPQPNGYGILPNCTAKPTAFGGGSGTIMGYCDEIAPNYIRNVAMTFGLNHPCGNEPDRVVRVMKAHVMDRVADFPQCFAPVPPRPSPPPPIPRPSPSPAPIPPSGSWTNPLLITALPYTSGLVSGWTSSGQLPMFCNDTATPLDASGKRLAGRNIKVLRWRSGANAKGSLTVHSCGLTTQGSPTVSIRATVTTNNPLAGPWTCEGAATSGCGSQGAGFRLTIKLRPSTVYDIIVGSQGTVTPQFKVSVTAQDGTLVPWPTPLGSWRNPNQVLSLPFTTAQFSVFHSNTVPAECNDLVLRKKDAITKYTGPARVFRLWMGSATSGRLTVNSCAGTRAGDSPNVSVRATTNSQAPLNGPWQCIGLPRTASGNGCGATNNGFNLTIPVAPSTWYYIIVSHTNTGAAPLLRLTVAKG